ncbi:MAG: PKD domain-containing protein [Bacteroidia bacterium]|nr:PKD domain-containing protein [Bacteroidia bacterium]
MIEQDYKVRLEVKNSLGLRNSITKTLEINHKNLPPVAFFKTSSIGGNTKSTIRFDAWGSRDLETIPSRLLMRWDFNADGIFDTDFTMGPEMYHRFEEPGQFPVVLEVKDEGGLTDTYSQMVYISPGTGRSDILLDKRGYNREYYGIVEVGHQWWFSKNLTVYSYERYQQVPYNGDEKNAIPFGYLYPRGVLDVACPDGWRVPSRADCAITASTGQQPGNWRSPRWVRGI